MNEKICPFLPLQKKWVDGSQCVSSNAEPVPCRENQCALWIIYTKDNGECAITSIASGIWEGK